MSALIVGAALFSAACAGGDDAERIDQEPTPENTAPTPDDSTAGDVSGSVPEPTSPATTVSDDVGVAEGEIAIRTDSAVTLDRRLFGTNVPAWLGPDKLSDPAFQAATIALGTTLLRFPGGSWSNGYDWLACERAE